VCLLSEFSVDERVVFFFLLAHQDADICVVSGVFDGEGAFPGQFNKLMLQSVHTGCQEPYFFLYFGQEQFGTDNGIFLIQQFVLFFIGLLF
jgi:hypothetical protein